jgi:hypothetical protein
MNTPTASGISDPAVASAVAAGRVPPDITIAWLEESRDQAAIAAITFVLVLTSLVVIGRLISRALVLKRFGYDDGLAALSLVSGLRQFQGKKIVVQRPCG